MKKFTFLMIALLCAVVTFAAGPKKQFTPQLFTPAKAQVQLGKQFSAKQAPARLAKQTKATAKARAPKKAVTAADLAGTYLWEYAMASDTAEDPTTVEGTDYSAYVTITAGDDETVTISGMFTNDLTGTIDTEYGVIVVEGGQVVGTSQYGDYAIYGLFYYEGDEVYEAGWYYNDIYIDINEDGSLTVEDWLVRVLSGGDYDGYNLTPYFMPGSTLTPTEAPEEPEVVVAPEGLEFVEYALSYTDYNGSAAYGTASVGIDGDDVYFKGFSSYIPDALIKGTKDGNTITFAANQYLGSYSGYDSYFIEETVFTYDAEADTYTATGNVYSLLGGRYIDVYATNPVLKGVVEKAATPADPAITALQNGSYGWYITFNVPNVDVDGNGMVSSKLSYIIYTDTEGEIAPLTFTPETHTYLTEEMTEIPFGFTENYDFYDTQIYLNDLYSADWNNIGIQSIYRGGDEENATEIQWYHIKDYYVPVTGTDVTFDFNALPEDWPCSTGATHDGDITEDTDIVEGNVTLTVSPSTSNTPNRYWAATGGIQLRVYGGTLTFTVPEDEEPITKITFNNGRWNAGNSADSGEFDGNVWTGSAQKVVVTIAGNTQLNSIEVQLGEEDPKPITLPEGVEAEEFTLTMSNYYGTTEATKLVAFDGDDVYVQGLAYFFDEAFVKGTLNEDGQYVFKSGQLVGEDKYGAEYLVGLSVDEEGNFQYEPEFVFDFDAESRTLSLVEGTYFGESGEKDDAYLWSYTYSAVYTEGALVLPDVVELPEGVEAETWYIVANSYTGKVKGEEIGVAVDGSDIYLQGLCSYLPEAWVKGTIEDGKATFAGGQFYGTYVEEYEGEEYSYNLFFGGYGIDEETDETYLSDVVFDYDAEAGTLTTEDYILLNSSANYVSFYDYYENVSITRDMPELPQPLEAPEDLVTEPYMFTAFNTYFEEDMTPYQVKVGFYGDNEVYIQGLSTYIEDAWVKGTLENGVLTIPETYLGEYEGWGTADLYFSETEFIYDAEAGKFTSEAGFTTYDDDAYAYDEVSNVVLTKLVEKAIAPADPLVKNFVLIGVDDDNNTTDADGNPIFFAYPWMGLDIPVVDVDGDPLLQDKLSYVVYIVDENDIQKELTLTTDLYTGLEEDMTEIPYLFTDGYDIFTGGNPLYLEQDPEEIITWKKIGVQSIYRGLGEENRSNIGWFDITDYLAENNITVGIRDINAGSQKVVCFDLQGRRVAAPGKGLYIVNGKKMVLK